MDRQKGLHPVVAREGLDPSQRLLLAALTAWEGPMVISEIRRSTGMPDSTIRLGLRNLAAKGLVRGQARRTEWGVDAPTLYSVPALRAVEGVGP